jgi:hypothetical protein
MGVLTQEKKEQLFMNIIGESYRTDNEKKSLRNFLDHIISLPLDVASAAYYIKSSGISHDDYLKKIKIRDKTFDNSQSKLLEENLNYKKTRYGIITSILDDIIGRHREFKKIWLMICLLASNDIPKSYLKTIECSTMVDAFIHNLLEHFLITDNGDTFGVHHITQEIGLQYIEEKLSDDEKIKYLDNIVEHMTQYKKNDYVKTSMHLQSMMHQISCLNLNESKKKQYDIRLRLAFLHCCEHSKSPDLSKNTQRK